MRCSRGRGRARADGRRDARRHRERSGAVHRPGPPRAGHGLPVRARRGWTSARAANATCARCDLPATQGVAGALAGRARRARLELACTSATTTSPGRVAGSATTARTGSRRRRRSRPCCTCTAARRTCTRVTNWAWPTRPSARSTTTATSRRSTTTPRPSCAAASTWPRCSPAMGRISRDNARTPVQWDASPDAGFTTGTPWIGVNPNHVEINAAAQVDDPDSVFAHYRRLIDLRHTEPVVTRRRFHAAPARPPGGVGFLRRGADAELLVRGELLRRRRWRSTCRSTGDRLGDGGGACWPTTADLVRRRAGAAAVGVGGSVARRTG